MKRMILLLACLASLSAFARVDEDLCGWTSWNVKKQLTPDFSVHARNEYWFRERGSALDQWYGRIWVTYKATPWFSIGPGYEYLEQHTAENAAREYYKRRNDFFAQCVFSWAWGDFKFALRERYTYADECSNPRGVHDGKRPSKDRELNSDFFRTRLMVKYVIDKECPVTPFAYEEVFNWSLVTQTRTAAGFSYKINDNVSFDLMYIRQSKYHPRHRNNNVVSLDFNFSF